MNYPKSLNLPSISLKFRMYAFIEGFDGMFHL